MIRAMKLIYGLTMGRRPRLAIATVGLAILAAAPSLCLAGGGPENVIVVVNDQSWASKALANAFVRLRHIPPSNVVYVDDLSDIEQIELTELRIKVLARILRTIRQRGLEEQIDYIVYSSDFPTAI